MAAKFKVAFHKGSNLDHIKGCLYDEEYGNLLSGAMAAEWMGKIWKPRYES